MGQVYILNKEDFNHSKELVNDLVIKEVLTQQEAEEFIQLQSKFSAEITEPINILRQESLITINPMRANEFRFCLAMDGNNVIGYGYGYMDVDDEETYYLDTIGVRSEYRGQQIGTEIKIALIKQAFENSNVKRIKAITQEENLATISINMKLGFRLKELG